ncbi:MAG: hypothetical protein M3P96_08630 [Actinomycetota bacterium]|nr:hypothetical protein [Actinomycetota bacterium]
MTSTPRDRRPGEPSDVGASRLTPDPQPAASPAPTRGTAADSRPDSRADSQPAAAARTRGGTSSAGEVKERQREAFGGMKWGSAFFGWLSATGLAVILLSLATAAGAAIGLTTINSTAEASNAAGQAAANADTIGITGGIILLVILMLAYYAGGYVAGRMARFDGARQGLAVWIIGIALAVLAAVLGAIAGARYNVLANLNLPAIPVSGQQLTTAGLIALAAVLVGTLLAAIAGGKLGERYHRKIDRVGLGR